MQRPWRCAGWPLSLSLSPSLSLSLTLFLSLYPSIWQDYAAAVEVCGRALVLDPTASKVSARVCVCVCVCVRV